MSEEKQSNRGGRREGAGRRCSGRSVAMTVRISPEALDKLNELATNKSEYIEALVLKAYKEREAGE